MKRQNIPGLAYAVVSNGKPLLRGNFGYASLEYKVPVSDSSRFWIASISKHMTCVAIMLLKQDGVLELDVPIKTYLHDAPETWDAITIRHLMTHTSGLPNYEGNARNNIVPKKYSADEIYSNIKKDSLLFNAGEQFSYSDDGMNVLGYIIHKISGMSFNEFMQKHIFDPAKMQTAYLMDQVTIHPNQVTGYALIDGKVVSDRNRARIVDVELISAGGVFASIDDMIHWDAALNTNLLLTEESKTMMYTPYTLNNGKQTGYGFGWFTTTMDNQLVLFHNGASGVEFLKLPDNDLSIIVLINQRVTNKFFAAGISDILGTTPDERKDYISKHKETIVTAKKSDIKPLLGHYKFTISGNKGELSAIPKEENTRLILNFPDGQSIELLKLTDGSWLFYDTTFPLDRENEIAGIGQDEITLTKVKNSKPLTFNFLFKGEIIGNMEKIGELESTKN
ncbi:serine hydrolase domain-containing protein [Formosa haliotis]|uniref:serine hydrolase domain-containing protein n=1 Tax=Formosa haliotis TaxID=1555194 RepID=UPI00082681A0|nr:serine hydrolase domain-containing protein [Formosa haliotis]